MRKISKNFNNPPDDLQQKAKEELPKLFEKYYQQKRTPKRIEGYNTPQTKEQLKRLYHNKCAFCERKLSDNNDPNTGFTIEHYRPQTFYYWLAYEWSNLLPVCSECNGKKEDKFPPFINSQLNKKRENPPIANNYFDETQFLANSPTLLAENPQLLHPEIDDVENFFVFELTGNIIPNPNNKPEDIKRAKETIRVLGWEDEGRPLFKARKKIIDELQARCRAVSLSVAKLVVQNGFDTKYLYAYTEVITDLRTIDDTRSFTLLRKQINNEIETFILEPISQIDEIYANWIRQAIVLLANNH
jgi:uncharacterized protein (TIGR02646 family)